MDSPPPLARRFSHPFTLLAAGPAWILAAIQIGWVWPFFSDDSFISLRFASRLLAGDGLTWTDGEHVEGYSNLLWVLACASLGALGIDLVTAARGLGMLCTAGGLWLLAAAARPRSASTALLAALSPLLVASTTQVMAWTAAGLEGPMVLLLLVWGTLAVLDLRERHETARSGSVGALIRCGVPFGLLVLARPDGPLWALSIGTALGLAALPNGFPVAVARATAFGSAPLLALCGQTLFRWFYHGDVVANTAHVKLGLGGEAFEQGQQYVGDGLWTVQGLAWCALLATVWLLTSQRGRRAVPILVLPLAAWLLYLATIGGDHFPAWRLLHPALAPLALLVAWACRHLSTSRRHVVIAVGLAAIGTIANVMLSRTEPLSVHVRSEKWEWQGKVIGEALGRAFADRRPLLAVDAAGALPFYSRLPALDMLGLCDRTIARTATPSWARAAGQAGGLLRSQGHLRGNGAYVMERAPDLMQFNTPPGMPLPVFLSGLEFEDDRRFLDGYRLVVLELDGSELPAGLPRTIQSFLWIRVEGVAGIRRAPDRIQIPAYLLGAYRLERAVFCRHEPPASADEGRARQATAVALAGWIGPGRPGAVVPAQDGEFELLVKRSGPLTLELEVPTGNWRVEIEPAESGFVGEVEDDRVTLRPTATVAFPARIRSVTLTR